MEVVAVAALAILGYELKGKTPRPQRASQPPVINRLIYSSDQAPTVPPMRNVEFDVNASANMPYHNNMVPFFGSQGAQNTNDSVKQSRLNTFTGTDGDFYKSKSDPTNRVNPEETKTNIYGNPVMSDEERMRNFANPTFYNNVNADPTSNQQVGPGLGLPIGRASAGGFHPDSVMRVLPGNVNEHRVNQLDSLQATAGHSSITGISGHTGESVKTIVPRFYNESQHPTMPTGGVLNAPMAPTSQENKDTTRGLEGGLWGAGASSHVGAQGKITDYNPRGRKLADECAMAPMPAMNMGSTSRAGVYHMPETDREKCTPILNLVGPGAETNRDAWDARATLRQCNPFSAMSGPAGTAVSATQSRGLVEERAGRQVLPTSGNQNVNGIGTGYAPIGTPTCKNQALCSYDPRNPSLGNAGAHTGFLTEFDTSGGRIDADIGYFGKHGQGPQQVMFDEETYDLPWDGSYNRMPHQGKVYASRGELGEVELK